MNELKDYILILEDIIPDKLCNDILNEYENSKEWLDTAIGGKGNINKEIRNCTTIEISLNEVIEKNKNVRKILDDEVFILDDETKLKWDKWSSEKSFKRQSSNWIKQQLMKLFNNVSEKDYLIIDSDLIITKPLQIYNGDTINFFLGNNQNNYEYFNSYGWVR
jgi:hypothetical protein